MKKFNTLPVKEQAYIIVSVIAGSWLYNALYPQIEEDEEFYTKFVNEWRYNEGVGDVKRFDEYLKWSDVEDCKLILFKMDLNGFDVVEPSAVDRWTDEEIDDFLVNYGPHWLQNYNKARE